MDTPQKGNYKKVHIFIVHYFYREHKRGAYALSFSKNTRAYRRSLLHVLNLWRNVNIVIKTCLH